MTSGESMHRETNLMTGKRGLVMGVANNMSIAWGIAEKLVQAGAQVALTYPNEMFEKRVRPLAASLGDGNGDVPVFMCDVTDETSIERLRDDVASLWGTIDFLVHAIAFSDKEELKGEYVATSRANFLNTLDVSCYSFTALARAVRPLMTGGGSLLTLTYYGAEKVMPHYNVMGVAKAALEASVQYLASDLGGEGIRVNALSAGPIKTLAASGIGDFRYILKWNQYNSPLKRNITQEDIAGSALYLLSDLSSGVTGEIHHVDAGYHVVGMKRVDAPDIAVV